MTGPEPAPAQYDRPVDEGSEGQQGAPRRRLRILLVIKGLGYGGAERLLAETVATGDRDGFDYEVAYVLATEDGLAADIGAQGTAVHGLGATRSVDVRWVGRLRTLIQRGSFDVVHFHLPYSAALGRLAVASVPRTSRPAVVYTEHSLWNKAAVVTKAINGAGIGRDQSLIVVSQAAHDALPPRLRARARVIVHGLDMSRADALLARRDEVRESVRSELGIPSGHVLVLAVANFRAEKGYDVLLDAVRVLHDRGVRVRVAAVGQGPLEDEMRRRHQELGLGDELQFLGLRDDVLRLLAGSDVFVLASRQEGLPVSLMEATGTATPIVATSVGGVPQVITDGINGLIVPPGDPVALADALERVASDPGLRRRLGAGAKRTSAMFDVTSATREIEGIYRDLAAGPEAGARHPPSSSRAATGSARDEEPPAIGALPP
jgi:glycosyltransferase involved in cell wall biosynthesis